ncbi:glycosyltransferase family 4 protein [Herbaspirillum sp. LeCh32-8]|uniref:glycosyltransferase family 4 protein n=1 Tax=Herbaspirillum sp. LeCh32-8 TaxID=2821356 RepID=UPI001AE70D91|nr:glycosyltransferase family 4 protein [Herbaspirillum sp. LeCh32-8]MBP0598378.1 glycosyltransferase family 4 protein [Herbaspirillum sp. LeCh32-8]
MATTKDQRIHISMIMYGGLSYGGAHRQTIRLACALDRTRFAINYFWCKPNQDLNSDFVWPELDYSNIELMRSHGINVIEFKTQTRDIANKYHPWINTTFFEEYAKVRTDLVFASRGGYPEYPFIKLREPIIEWNIFGCADPSPNMVCSAAISHWAHANWKKAGLPLDAEIIYPAVPGPADVSDLRAKLGIGDDAVVLGFHQRQDDHIYGDHALRAYAAALPTLQKPSSFIIVGGSPKYRALAAELGVDVHFLPIAKEYEDVSSFLHTLDIFAHSGGAGEAHGTVIQEAMMHGLPSITMLLEGKADGQVGTMAGTGLVTRTVGEYAQAITDLVNDGDRRHALGAQARAIASERYAIAPVTRRFEEIFTEKAAAYRGRRFSPLNRVALDFMIESSPFLKKLRARLPFLRRFI